MSGKTITHSFTTTTTLGRGGIGLYGKVPSLGDFISRRLPKMFIADWDAWLQHSLLISREKLGDRWLDLYLGMPMWRFCVGPGILSGEMWMGVLVPSVDRVGRYFPLTIAASLPENTDMAATFSSSSVWFENVEAAALELLKASASFEKIDPALAALPRATAIPKPSSDDSTVPLPRSTQQFLRQSFVGHWGDEGFALRLGALERSTLPPASLWSAVDPQATYQSIHVSQGLPKGDRFTALIDEQWEAHGWQLI